MDQSRAERMSFLLMDDGYRITYTSIGDKSQPLLLFIVGSTGLGSLYRRLALELSACFHCVYYDKRGFLSDTAETNAAVDQENPVVSVHRHSLDAQALIRHLSKDAQAYAFGTSTGGTIALDLAIHFPDLLRCVILHEPITFSVIQDASLREDMIELYYKVGKMMSETLTAYSLFREYMFNPPKNRPISGQSPNESQRQSVGKSTSAADANSGLSTGQLYNSRQGLAEATAMADYHVVKDRTLAFKDKLILVCGVESSGLRVSKPGRALAEFIGKRDYEVVGDHTSFAGKKNAKRFCVQLLEILDAEGYWSSKKPRTGPAKL